MEIINAVRLLGALAQDTRLSIFRLLVQAGKNGLAVGTIAQRLEITASGTLTFHLKELSNSGLISSRQEGRFIYYSANYEEMTALLRYLTENCCGGMECEKIASSCDPETGTKRILIDKGNNHD